MLSRSVGMTPRTSLMPIFIPSPSGYCGATSCTRHSGRTKSPARASDASAVSMRDRRDILLPALARFTVVAMLIVIRLHATVLGLCDLAHVRRQRHVKVRCRYPNVSLHFLVQRRAEIGAVERIDTSCLRHPSHRSGLAWRKSDTRRIGTEHCEAVRDVPVLFDVGDVEVHGVAELYAFQIVRSEVTANGDHLNIDALATACDSAA